MNRSRNTFSKAEFVRNTSAGPCRARIKSIVVLCILSAIGISLLLFVKLPTSRAWSAVQNIGHFFLFATLAVAYIIQIEKVLAWKFLTKAAFTLIVLTIIGVLAEAVQTYLPGRDASSSDLWRNLAGVTTGLSTYACYWYRTKLNKSVLALCLLSLVSIILWICRPTIELVGYALLKSPSPAVISFSDQFVQSMISTIGGAKRSLEMSKPQTNLPQQHTLRMDFAQQLHSGIILHEPSGQWHEYTNLVLHIFNAANKSRTLELRIHDVLHDNRYEDRFNTNFHMAPGENEILIPIESISTLGGNSNQRNMDMQNISEIQLFSATKEPFTLFLKDIVLAQD